MSPKLLASGGIRAVDRRVERPILYQFIGSFNSGKATLAVALSQVAKDCDIRYTLHLRDNYTVEYARLNPDTMAVPTMEIDDKVCTDSYDMIKYLMENYPGPGDQEVVAADRKQEMMTFVDFVVKWDEYMFTYAQQGQEASDMANGIRLVFLRQNLNQVLTEKPDDVDFLVNAYIKKIAGVTNMKRAQVDGEQKNQDVEENKAYLHHVLARGDELVGQNPSGFLFGNKLTTGDVFFLPIFGRIFHIAAPAMFEEVFGKYPNLKGYWERAQANPAVQDGLMKYVQKSHMVCTMISSGVPCILLKWKLGCLKAPTLPAEIEKRIDDKTDELWKAVRG